MKPKQCFAFNCLLAVIGGIGTLTWQERVRAAELSEQEVKEIRRVERSLEDGLLPMPPGWTFNHGASLQGRKELEEVGHPSDGGDLEAVVRRAGGWAAYKAGIASLLHSKDLVVRGFAAVLLADLGDKTYSKDLLALLQAESTPGDNDVFPDWDRGCAAQALGVIGDRDHGNELAKFLKHGSATIRAGAATGLGWMQAKDHQKEVAALLDDHEEKVVCSAIEALAMLGEKQYASRFAKIATKEDAGDSEQSAALNALVAMHAIEEASEIAKLLQPKYNCIDRGKAIMALACMSRKEYAKGFAALLDDKDVHDSAMLALGILSETRYADKIAPFLHAEERSDRQASAWSLIMMESNQNASAAIDVYSAFEQEQTGIPRYVPESASRSLKKRFQQSLARLKKSR